MARPTKPESTKKRIVASTSDATRSDASRLISNDDRPFAEAVAGLAYSNPFLPERIELEKRALGGNYVAGDLVWSYRLGAVAGNSNVVEIARRTERLLETLRSRLASGVRPRGDESQIYERLVFYVLFDRYQKDFLGLITNARAGDGPALRAPFWSRFEKEAESLFAPLPRTNDDGRVPSHLFALLFQIRRAFHFVYVSIVGRSLPIARLRASVWQSLFTHDLDRYRRSLHTRMGDVTTLVTGPSGTGKELVARAIASSRYLPFDPPTGSFKEESEPLFHPLNLSALSPTLIESELFGHRRGSFTGALEDRTGRLESCPPTGTVFLDEIGDVDPAIQVKLLRVLETRVFERVGDVKPRPFTGKIVAATNRDLVREIEAGRFRRDFYYRLCADVIRTPPLSEQISDAPDDLRNLTLHLARRVAGDSEAEALATETIDWIERRLGTSYAWPGNVRELEQCVRNILVRREYVPPAWSATSDDRLDESLVQSGLSADDVVARYCAAMYDRVGSLVETAKRLSLDRRTVRAKLDRVNGSPRSRRKKR